MIELLSWNVAARKGRLTDQAAAIRDRRPDILALQEVPPELVQPWEAELRANGLVSVEPSLEEVGRQGARGVLLAGRWPLERLPIPAKGFPFPEKILGALVTEASGVPFEIYTTHVPPGVSNGWGKIEHLEAVYRLLATPSANPRILCGDFNAPRAEWADGTVITWAQDPDTGVPNRRPGWRLRRRERDPDWNPTRWEDGERNVLEGLAKHDLTDVFRILGRFPPGDKSWYWRGLEQYGRRFDHIFASERLRPSDAGYLHCWREQRLSDHSPIWAQLEPPA
jgi:exonuclease III